MGPYVMAADEAAQNPQCLVPRVLPRRCSGLQTDPGGTSAQNVSYVSFATVKPFPVRVFQQVIPEDSLVQATLPFFADSP